MQSGDSPGKVIASSSAANLLLNGDFASGSFTNWTTIANDSGGNSPSVETFSPSSGLYSGSAPSGENNYYVEAASGNTSAAESGIYQEASCGASTAFTFSGMLGGSYSDDGVYVEAIFKNSSDVELPIDNNFSLIAGDSSTASRNGTYIKTSLRGAIEFDSGMKFKTSNSDYPVYKLSNDAFIMKNLAFGSDRWSIFDPSGWGFDDLENNYSLGSFSESILSMSGDDSHSEDSLKYPPISSSDLYRYSDHYMIATNADIRYRDNGGSFDEAFFEKSITGTSPASASKVRVEARFDEESNSTCYAYISSLSFVES